MPEERKLGRCKMRSFYTVARLIHHNCLMSPITPDSNDDGRRPGIVIKSHAYVVDVDEFAPKEP